MANNSSARNRLPVTNPTTRALYLYSGNQCGFPNCSSALLLDDGTWDCNVAHIYGVQENAARGQHNLTSEELRAPENLLLVCQKHHKVLDNKQNESKYTVKRMQEIKSNHEQRFREAFSGLERIVDTSMGFTIQFPTNLRALEGSAENTHELEQNLKDMEPFFRGIAKQPPGMRDLLRLILLHGEIGKLTWKRDQVSVEFSQIEGVAQLSQDEIVRRAKHLELAGLLLVEDDDDFYFFTLRDPTSNITGWDLFSELKNLGGVDEQIINRAIDSLDFTVFDR